MANIQVNGVSGTVKVPGHYANVNFAAGAQAVPVAKKVLLLGHASEAAVTATLDPVRITSATQGYTLFGSQTQLGTMCYFAQLAAPEVELYAFPLPTTALTRASLAITVTGTTSAEGTLSFKAGAVTYSAVIPSGLIFSDPAVVAALTQEVNNNHPEGSVTYVDLGTTSLTLRAGNTVGYTGTNSGVPGLLGNDIMVEFISLPPGWGLSVPTIGTTLLANKFYKLAGGTGALLPAAVDPILPKLITQDWYMVCTGSNNLQVTTPGGTGTPAESQVADATLVQKWRDFIEGQAAPTVGLLMSFGFGIGSDPFSSNNILATSTASAINSARAYGAYGEQLAEPHWINMAQLVSIISAREIGVPGVKHVDVEIPYSSGTPIRSLELSWNQQQQLLAGGIIPLKTKNGKTVATYVTSTQTKKGAVQTNQVFGRSQQTIADWVHASFLAILQTELLPNYRSSGPDSDVVQPSVITPSIVAERFSAFLAQFFTEGWLIQDAVSGIAYKVTADYDPSNGHIAYDATFKTPPDFIVLKGNINQVGAGGVLGA